MKSKVDKVDIGKLETTSVDLSKLINVVKNYVVKKDVYNAKIRYIEDKIPDITNLTTKTTIKVACVVDIKLIFLWTDFVLI